MTSLHISRAALVKGDQPGGVLAAPGLSLLLAAAVMLLIGFHYSIARTLPYLRSDNPVGYVPFVPLVAVLFVWGLSRRMPRRALLDREPFLDVPIALLLGSIAFYMIAILPSQASWAYWINRYDLLAFPLATVAAIVLVWGVQAAWVLRAGLLFGFLFWPRPWELIYSQTADGLARTASALIGAVIRLLPLGVSSVPGDPQTFSVGSGAQQVLIGVGQTCAGTGIITAALLFSLPILFLCAGAWHRKALWMTAAVVLAFLSNLLRLFVLLAVAGSNPTLALGVLHPILGAVFFGVLILVMLLTLPAFGLHWRAALPASERASWLIAFPFPPMSLFAALGIAAVLFAVFDQNLREFGWMNQPSSLPALASTSADAALPPVAGWQLAHEDEIDWRQLFGPDTVANVYSYARPDGMTIYVQNIMTTNEGALNSRSLENCDLFHGRTIVGVERVYLGHGATGLLVDSVAKTGSELAVLYWIQPVVVQGKQYFSRVALFIDVAPGASLSAGVPPTPGLFQRFSYRFLETFSGYHVGPGSTALSVHRQIAGLLATQIIDGEIQRSSAD